MRRDDTSSQSVQRAKVGLIGLAAVILLIGLASAVMRSVRHEAPVTALGAAKPEVVANLTSLNVQDGAGEPLAEMGAAPGAANSQSAARVQP